MKCHHLENGLWKFINKVCMQGWGCSRSLVECLPSMCKTLGPIHSTEKERNRGRRQERGERWGRVNELSCYAFYILASTERVHMKEKVLICHFSLTFLPKLNLMGEHLEREIKANYRK